MTTEYSFTHHPDGTERGNHPETEQVMQARAYVTSRFFPPLPVEYGDLAVQAIQVYQEYGPEAPVALPTDLNPLPHGYWDEDGARFVRASTLISALRLEHMLDDEDF